MGGGSVPKYAEPVGLVETTTELPTPVAQAIADQAIFHNTDLPWAQTVAWDGIDIDAEFKYGEDIDEQSGVVITVLMLWVKKGDVPAPTYRTTVVVEGVTWYYRRREQGDGVNWHLIFTTDERPVI